MKRYTKILIKKDNQIKAILDTDGKILTDDKRLKEDIQRAITKDLVTQKLHKGFPVSTLTKVTSEGHLFMVLQQELVREGYAIE